MLTIESLEDQFKPRWLGLLGIRLTEADKDRGVATMMVRPDSFPSTECGKLCAVVTQTQLILPASEDAR